MVAGPLRVRDFGKIKNDRRNYVKSKFIWNESLSTWANGSHPLICQRDIFDVLTQASHGLSVQRYRQGLSLSLGFKALEALTLFYLQSLIDFHLKTCNVSIARFDTYPLDSSLCKTKRRSKKWSLSGRRVVAQNCKIMSVRSVSIKIGCLEMIVVH